VQTAFLGGQAQQLGVEQEAMNMSNWSWRLVRLMGGKDWREDVDALHELEVVPAWRTTWICILNVLRTVTEAFGLVMIWPILEFVEKQGQVQVLAEKSEMWRVLIDIFGIAGLPVTLETLSGAVLLLILLRQLVAYLSVIGTNSLREDVGLALRKKLFSTLLDTKATYLSQLGSGRFIALIGEQSGHSAATLRNLINLFSIYVTVGSYLVVLMGKAPTATFVAGIFGGILILLVQPLQRRAKQLSKLIVGGQVELGQFTSERYRNWRLLKLSGSEGRETIACMAIADRLVGANVNATRAAAQIQLYIGPAIAAFALSGLWFAVNILTLTLSDITLFIIVIFRLLPVLTSYLNTRQGLANTSVALHYLRDQLRLAVDQLEVDLGTKEFRKLEREIRFDDVTVFYPGRNKPALNTVSTVIPAHSITAITGPSGSGKSTLVDLLPSLIVPASGCVVIDETPLKEFSLKSLRDRIAYVSQEPVLFDGTVTDNVRYGKSDVSDEQVREACKLANIDKFIEALPYKYETRIGENGRALSGGQRQRLALARIFLSDATLLILDEPTSALDLESEINIRDALDTLCKVRELTIIVIAHRLFTIKSANHLIVIKDGRVVEQGRPADLAMSDSWFRGMLARDQIQNVPESMVGME
jgi:subfamily B ATP-binding cassette protein MsbA